MNDELIYSESGTLIYEHFAKGHKGFDRCLGFNYEHPMFAKILYGLFIGVAMVSGSGITPLLASRIAISFIGALTCVALYLFGTSLFNRRVGIISTLILSFSSLFIFGTVHALLDNMASFFVLMSVFLFYLWSRERKTAYLVLSSVSFGLATASKFIGFLTLPILLMWFLLGRKTEKRKILKIFFIFCLVGLITFFLVQPRLWYDPVTRLENTWKFNYYHLKVGYYLPIEVHNYLPEEKRATSWWLIPKYLFYPQSLFEIIGILVLASALHKRKLNNESLMMLLLFFIPFLYLLAQPVRLFHYVIFLIPFLSLIIGYSYDFLIGWLLEKKRYLALFLISYLFVLHLLFDFQKGAAKNIKTFEWFNYPLEWAVVIAVAALVVGLAFRKKLEKFVKRG